MVIRRGAAASTSDERFWRQEVQALVGPEQLRVLSQPSVSDTLAWSGVLWLEIAVLIAAANLIVGLPAVWAVVAGIAIVVLMGTRMNALGVVIHEGSHGLLASDRGLNDRLTNWFAAYWSVNSVEEYRPTHRLHHRYLGSERDPDRFFYLVPARRGALAFLMLQDLTCVTAIRRATTRISGTSQVSDAPAGLLARPRLLAGKAVTQLVVLGQFVLFQGVLRGLLFYAVFWLVPIVCLYPAILRLKTIVEHYDPALRKADSVTWTARTSWAGWFQNHLVGARMEFHFEHHVLPTIPYRGLKALHRQLERQASFFADHGEFLSHGYAQFLARATTGKLGAGRSGPAPLAGDESRSTVAR